MNDEPILGFKDDYRFLSNFWYARQVDLGGVEYEFNEKFYMVHKTMFPEERAAIMEAKTPGECKRAGRKATLRLDWEDVKNQVMLEGLRLKFGQNPYLAIQLLGTEYRYLEEANTWGDTYWGTCNGVGRNMLGILLMQVRAELSMA